MQLLLMGQYIRPWNPSHSEKYYLVVLALCGVQFILFVLFSIVY